MRLITSLVLIFSSILSAFAQNIEDELVSKDSDIIVLNDQTIFRIESKDRSLFSRRYEVIIKNKYATEYKNIYLDYDKYRTVISAEAEITDLAGNLIEKFKIKDFNDYATGGGVAEDGRMKVLEPNYSKYPFKIYVYYEIEKNGSLHYPIWSPQDDENIYIQSSEFIVMDNSNNSFRYDSYNLDDPEVKKIDSQTTYRWKVQNLSTFKYETYNYNFLDYAPRLYTAPTLFQMDGISGNMSDWKSFGEWQNQLNLGKNDISKEQLLELDALVQKGGTIREKAKIIYEYLQANTRYVSIQLGIGGWQPFSSSFVHEKKYGDCKALTFYTQSLLNNYGIKSYYTLIRGGNYSAEVNKNFPNAHFNHAILTLPIEQDTIFLECTSQTDPFGYQGKFTSNRNALMITDKGGQIIHTKKYSATDNLQQSKIIINLKLNGSAFIKIDRKYSGIEIDNYNFYSLYRKSNNDLNKWLIDNHEFDNTVLNEASLKPVTGDVIPSAGFTSSLDSEKEAKIIGNRLFLSPEKFFESYLSKVSEKTREKSINIKYGYSQLDTLIYKIPENVYVEGSPKTYELDTKFGSYKKEYNLEQGKVTIIRKFIFNDGTYPASDFEDFKDFVNSVLKSDRDKLVLLNKT